MKSAIPVLVAVVAVHGGACAQESRATRSVAGSEVVAAAASSITVEDYLRKISIIAHDSMGGRGSAGGRAG